MFSVLSHQDAKHHSGEEPSDEALPRLLRRQLEKSTTPHAHNVTHNLNLGGKRTQIVCCHGAGSDLDEGGASEEKAKHVGHDVITDHTGDGHYEPGERGREKGGEREREKVRGSNTNRD